jgi:TonB family protein
MYRMFGTVFFAFFLCITVTPKDLFSQSIGNIPSSYYLPSPDATVRFTSHEKPGFHAPVYPARHLEVGTESVVEVALYVTSEGNVIYSEITVASGNEDFDKAALESAMQTVFPAGYATVNGESSNFMITVPYYFLLSADPEQYWHTRLELARIQKEYDELMNKFQSYLAQRTSVTKAKMQETRDALEVKIAVAKKLHRVLAEKKESAILRLRSEITATRAQIRDNDELMRDPNSRPSYASSHKCEVKVSLPQTGIVTVSSVNSDIPILEQLASDIELKKSYL